MIRLLVLLACVGLTLMALLQLRQQQQAIRAQNLRLHRQIRALEQTLWRQQVMVGADLAPGALEHHLGLNGPDTGDAEPAPAAPLPPVSAAAWEQILD